MTPRASAIAEVFRTGFAAVPSLDPADVDELVLAIVGHLRQLRPEQFGCLSTLPVPTEPVRDPRSGGAA